MSTYTQIIYQIVFGPKNNEKTLTKKDRAELFKYISGIISNKKCHLYQINGVEDHIHIVTHLHPSVALASLIKDIKVASSIFIRKANLFQSFSGWQDGYGAFTYSIKEKDRLINYVKNQETHHKSKILRDEMIDLLNEHGIEFDEKYLL
ncbi:MAG: transposase [Bacteroidetes bacterium RIFOXYA12_FULL_35_11]|nr:MAG: transposase [Bacteroidetes bacterium GWF2_35_48]OFY81007.1 MAG: transposase [Bacteroidetes bacterium RIFOXYA12_FULL_35_11]OFY94185.1 MAG: transposase [Bacteroidetes bacterium RIFOXYC12_FULL_35_7]HBX49969.1 IS200/IS605 family transposase [Bacteroidales bacterium]